MARSFSELLRGKFLVSDDAFKNWRYIIVISVLAIIMIASSHSADSKVYEIAKLTEEVKELKSLMVNGRTKLMKMKMESTIIKKVKEKGILISEIPPQKIIVTTK